MKRTPVLHSFFLAVYPILFLLAFNVVHIAPSQAVRPLIISLSVTAVLLLLFGGLTKNWRQGGLTVSLFLLLFFSYGHVYRALNQSGSILANHIILGSLWLLVFTAGFLLKWRISNTKPITRALNIITAVLLIYPLYTIGLFFLQSGGDGIVEKESPLAAYQSTSQIAPNELPDVYYIIVDGYGRSDVLQELYGYDNSEFIRFLEDRGFYVAEKGRSNYLQTSLSLASSLNLDYLDELTVNEQSQDITPLVNLIQDSEVRSFLEAQGYQTVAFETGYPPTTLSDADTFIPYNPDLVNDLENLLLIGSATAALGDRLNILFNPFLCEVRRGNINNIFAALKNIPSLNATTFTFTHIMSPHPPFVFGANGEAVNRGGCLGLDGDHFEGTPDEYRDGYGQQAAYISQRLEETLDFILNNSATPPIIILQGDHGPAMTLDWESIDNSCMRERSSILNAYYFPKGSELLYDSITPVNSFRLLFNANFDTELPLLEDRTYFSSWGKLYQFTEITDQIEESCTPN